MNKPAYFKQFGAEDYNIPETVLDGVSDGGYTDREFASRIVGQDRFVHNINVRRLLHHSHLDA